jgi:glucosamine--fructose-6-phosphate aminotransferase (isomerizing)
MTDGRQSASHTFQTILRQPDDLRTMFAREGTSIAAAASVLRSGKRVVTIGIGSSYHACQVGAWFLREAGGEAIALHAFDALHYPELYRIGTDDVVVIYGHTGNTGFTKQLLASLTGQGVSAVAIGSTEAVHPGAHTLLRTTEPEKAATYTSSHLCAMAITAAVAVGMGAGHLQAALDAVPDQIAAIIERRAEIWPIAESALTKRIYAYGAGPNEITATELMIKTREAAFHKIDGLAAEQFLHGPTVSFNAGDLAVVIHVDGPAAERVGGIARVNQAMGGEIWTVGQPIEGVNGPVFNLPVVPESISALLAVVPMQLLASRMSALKGTNPDTFRMDDPLYNAAFTKVGF